MMRECVMEALVLSSSSPGAGIMRHAYRQVAGSTRDDAWTRWKLLCKAAAAAAAGNQHLLMLEVGAGLARDDL
jgi:hypothetical protein